MEPLESRILMTWTGATSGSTNDAAHNYNNISNWSGGVIDDSFASVNLTANTTIYLTADRTTGSAGMNLGYGGNFDLTLKSSSTTTRTLTLGGAISGDFGGSANARTVSLGNPTNKVNLNLGNTSRTFTVPSADKLVIYNTVSSGSLVMSGLGTLSLVAQNTYAGGTIVNSGKVLALDSSTGSPGAVTSGPLGTGTIDLVGGSLGADSTRTLNNAVIIDGNIGLGAGGSLTLGGSVTLTGDRTIYTLGNQATISGAIGEDVAGRGLIKDDYGVLYLSGHNTYSGLTDVRKGTLQLDGTNSSSGNTRIHGSTLILGSNTNNGLAGGTLTLDGSTIRSEDVNARTITNALAFVYSNIAFGALGTGDLTFTNPTSTVLDTAHIFTINNAQTTFDNGFVDSVSGRRIIKQGSGTMVLDGASTYSGGTRIDSGNLLVHNTSGSATGSGYVSVASGGLLGGSGSMTGGVSVAAGGVIAPGDLPGTTGLLATGSLSLLAGASYNFDFTSSEYDQISVTGTVNLGGATLNLSGMQPYADSSTIILIRNDGADAVTGSFAGLAEGAAITLNQINYRIHYGGNDGNDVVLIADPPTVPTSVQAISGSGKVTLMWASSSGATSYSVHRSTSSGTEGTTPLDSDVTGTLYEDSEVTPGVTYFYTVTAVNPGGESAHSTEVSATPLNTVQVNQIVANFDGGNGVSAVDQFSGVAGSGWSTSWQMRSTDATFTSASVINTNPLSNGGGNYLQATVHSEDTLGNARAAISRRFDPATVAGAGNPFQLELDWRLDSSTATFTNEEDRVYIFGDEHPRFAPLTTDTVLAAAYGAPHNGIAAKTWGVFDGDGAGNGTFVDTGILLRQGVVYHFTFLVDQSGTQYKVTLSDGQAGSGHTFTSDWLGWDWTTGSSRRYIEAGVRLHNFGDSITYSMDSVRVTAAGSQLPAAPVLSGIEDDALSYMENDPPLAVTSGARISDANDTDLQGATIQITGNYAAGEDRLAFGGLGNISGTWNAATGSLVLSGTDTLANYQAALRLVSYLDTSESPSTLMRTISFTVRDGTSASTPVSRQIAVVARNDAPTINVPTAAQWVTDGGPLVFSSQNGNAVSVNDVDAGGDDVTVTLSTAHGTMDLGSVTGLTAVSGDGTGTVNVTGSISAVNTALAGLSYTPVTGYLGSDVLTVAVSDLGHWGVGGAQSGSGSIVINATASNTSALAGRVWDDEDDDGVLDGSESGAANWRVYVDTNNDGQFQAGETSALTSNDGTYLITGLAPGNYTVRLVGQATYAVTHPTGESYSLALTTGQTIGGLDFGVFSNQAPEFDNAEPESPIHLNPFQAGALPPDAIWGVGDLFVGMRGYPNVQEYSTDGELVRQVNTIGYAYGMDFDLNGNLHYYQSVLDGSNTTTSSVWPPDPTSIWGFTEQTVVDAEGNVYINSERHYPMPTWTVSGILKFDRNGNFVDQFLPDTHVDQFDLAADQHTIIYQTELDYDLNVSAHTISTYDLNTKEKGPDFATGFDHLTMLRYLPDGGVLAGDQFAIKRLDSSGNIVQTYDTPDISDWFSIVLDRDGKSFWAGSLNLDGTQPNDLVRFDLETGEVLRRFTTPAQIRALALYGEPKAAVGGYKGWQFDLGATDPDGDALTYTFVDADESNNIHEPTGATLDPATGLMRWTPREAGTYTFTVRVSDPFGASDLKTFTVVVDYDVNGPNTAPAFSTSQAAQLSDGMPGSLYTNRILASDPDGDNLTYSLINSGGGKIAIDSATGVIQFVPTAADQTAGHRQFTVRIDDGRGGTADRTFTVPVRANVPSNQPPSFSYPAGSWTFNVGEAGVLDNYVGDPDGDPVQLQLIDGPAGMSVDGHKVRWTPTAAQEGTGTFTIAAVDGKGGMAVQTWNYSVANYYGIGMISSISWDWYQTEGKTRTFTAEVSDAQEFANATFNWSFTKPDPSAPDPIVEPLDGSGKSVSVTFFRAGNYQISVKASGTTSGQEYTKTTPFTLDQELASVLIAPTPVVVSPDQQFDFPDVTLLDQFGEEYAGWQELAPTWSFVPGTGSGDGRYIDPSTGLYTAGSGPGTDTVRVDFPINDGWGGVISGQTTVQVSSSPNAILFGTGQAHVTTEGQATSFSGIGATGDLAGFYDALGGTAAGDYSVLINWGDGTTSAGTVLAVTDDRLSATYRSHLFRITGTHTFGQQGAYDVHVQVTHRPSGRTALFGLPEPVTVNSAMVEATAIPVRAAVLQEFEGPVARFVDTAPMSDPDAFSAQIIWGDSSQSAGTIRREHDGSYTISGAHTYGAEGRAAARVQIFENGELRRTILLSIFVQPHLLPKPTGFTATAVSPTIVELKWDGAPDVWGYRFERINPDNSITVPDEGMVTTSNPYYDQNLQPGGTYTYRVIAVDEWDNYSTPSDPVEVTTWSPAMPATPADFQGEQAVVVDPVSRVRQAGVQLSWERPSDITNIQGYRVFRKVTPATGPAYWLDLVDGDHVAENPANWAAHVAAGEQMISPQQVLPGLRMAWFDSDATFADASSYEYRVVAYGFDGDPLSASAAVALTVDRDTTAPSAPTGLAAASYPQAIQLTWDVDELSQKFWPIQLLLLIAAGPETVGELALKLGFGPDSIIEACKIAEKAEVGDWSPRQALQNILQAVTKLATVEDSELVLRGRMLSRGTTSVRLSLTQQRYLSLLIRARGQGVTKEAFAKQNINHVPKLKSRLLTKLGKRGLHLTIRAGALQGTHVLDDEIRVEPAFD